MRYSHRILTVVLGFIWLTWLTLPQVERKLREIATRDSGKGVILKHLNMASRLDTLTLTKHNTRYVDPHSFFADSDPGDLLNADPAAFLCGSGSSLTTFKKNYTIKSFLELEKTKKDSSKVEINGPDTSLLSITTNFHKFFQFFLKIKRKRIRIHSQLRMFRGQSLFSARWCRL